MNENEHSSQLSALFDGELPAEQSELVIRRAMKDPLLRATWGRYALIGAAMRSEPLAIHSRLRDDVAARVAARLSIEAGAGERAARPMTATGDRGASFARGAWGMAIAASVAAVSLLVMRNQAPDGAPALLTADAAPAAEVLPPVAITPKMVEAPQMEQCSRLPTVHRPATPHPWTIPVAPRDWAGRW